jgi:hypothetical protein
MIQLLHVYVFVSFLSFYTFFLVFRFSSLFLNVLYFPLLLLNGRQQSELKLWIEWNWIEFYGLYVYFRTPEEQFHLWSSVSIFVICGHTRQCSDEGEQNSKSCSIMQPISNCLWTVIHAVLQDKCYTAGHPCLWVHMLQFNLSVQELLWQCLCIVV